MEQFGRYLRTGIWTPLGKDIEVKFNPWHDPKTGRFTFKDGGGLGGGGGASGSWDPPDTRPKTSKSASGPSATARAISTAAAPNGSVSPWQTVERNGYTYQIDTADRTRQVTGMLTLNPDQTRSRTSQAGAGGNDRLETDDGGHYIARRFNGPTDAFNHFAQDAGFNRGGYRSLENGWAQDIKQGKQVYVSIKPIFTGSSKRPSTLEVVYSVDGARGRRSFSNSSKGKSHGR